MNLCEFSWAFNLVSERSTMSLLCHTFWTNRHTSVITSVSLATQQIDTLCWTHCELTTSWINSQGKWELAAPGRRTKCRREESEGLLKQVIHVAVRLHLGLRMEWPLHLCSLGQWPQPKQNHLTRELPAVSWAQQAEHRTWQCNSGSPLSLQPWFILLFPLAKRQWYFWPCVVFWHNISGTTEQIGTKLRK